MAWSRAALVVVATRYGYIADFGKALPRLDERGHDHGHHQLAVGPDLALVEVEGGQGEDAGAVVHLHRLQVRGQDAAGVLRRELEEPAHGVAVAVSGQARQMPSSRRTRAITPTANSSSSSEWAADTEMRRRDLCLGTAG